jgi:hypothetical protein
MHHSSAVRHIRTISQRSAAVAAAVAAAVGCILCTIALKIAHSRTKVLRYGPIFIRGAARPGGHRGSSAVRHTRTISQRSAAVAAVGCILCTIFLMHSIHHSSAVRHTRTISQRSAARSAAVGCILCTIFLVHSMHHFSRAFYAPFFSCILCTIFLVHSIHHSSAVRHTRTIFSTFSSQISSRRVHSMHHFSHAFYAPFLCRTPYPDYFSTFSSRSSSRRVHSMHHFLVHSMHHFLVLCTILLPYAIPGLFLNVQQPDLALPRAEMAPPSGWNADAQKRVPTDTCFI